MFRLLTLLAAPMTAAAAPPNVVVILADDLGYGDVRAYNPASKIATPHIDRVAAGGMKFTDSHTGSSVCTPTRYGLLTGRYCWRTRLKDGVLFGYASHLIDPRRATLADIMRRRGYVTGCVGKWHLGMDLPYADRRAKKLNPAGRIKNGPNGYGFDYFFGTTASLDMPPYVYIQNDRLTRPLTGRVKTNPFPGYYRGGPVADDFKFDEVLDRLTDKAVGFIEKTSRGRKPFFLYFPLTSPHKPILPAARFRGKSSLGPYGDFVMQVDDVVGRVDRALRDAGVAKDTLLIVTSDNGSYMVRASRPGHEVNPRVQGYRPEKHTANGPWRGTKADIWEGGHRVPFIARWPARVAAGSACTQTICHTDVLATCAEAAGGTVPQGAGEDSHSFLPLLLGKGRPKPRPPVIHHSVNGTFAIRRGPLKLIFGSGSGGRGKPPSKPFSKPYQLYDLEADPAESKNLIADPARAAAVRELTAAARGLVVPVPR